MKVPWNIKIVTLAVTKHFSLDYLRKWGWDFHDLRHAITNAYKIDKIGKSKYEIYIRQSGYKKIISVYYDLEKKLLCITGSQGGKRK